LPPVSSQNIILDVKNEVLSQRNDGPNASVLNRAVDRALARQRAAYAREAGRLVQSTLRLIRERGVLEPSVAAIVRAAGLSNQAFYRHFRTKHELLVAVLDEGIRLLATYLEERMAAAATPAEQVEAWLRGVLEQALHPRGAAATRPFAVRRGELAVHHPEEVARSRKSHTAHYLAPLLARTRSQIQNQIRRAHYLRIMLHHQDRVSQIPQLMQNRHQPRRVPAVQSNGRFVQHIQRSHQPRSK
jgi:AcrR family transcriptional regulator